MLDNNTVTTNPNGTDTGKRLNGVKQTIQEYSDDDYTKGLQSIAEETMLGNTLDHQITIKILQNAGFNVQLYDKVSFIDTQKTYDTYVTRIENYNNKYKTIRLGVLRTTLTDKIKNLEKLLYKKTFGTQGGGSSSSGGSDVNIYDGVDSTSTTSALSANQGRVLNEKINDNLQSILDLQNSGFITRAVNDLINYYTKSESYTKQEVNELISLIPKFSIEVVQTLPSENISKTTIYLRPNRGTGLNFYEEYIYVKGQWELLGTPTLDLSGYVELDTFNNYISNRWAIASSNGGFKAGTKSVSAEYASDDVYHGGAIGDGARASNGGAIGNKASTMDGGAVGNGAVSGYGFAGGKGAVSAVAGIEDCIQLGQGRNLKDKTLQVYDDNIYNANTHTLTVKNIELDGEDIKDKIGAGGTKIIWEVWE